MDVAGPSGRLAVYQDAGRTWVWNAATRTATRLTAAPSSTPALPTPCARPARCWRRSPRSSSVTLGDPVTVAGRPAQTLVIRPTDRHSLIGSVRLAIDTTSRLPLAVKFRARRGGPAVLKVAFTELRLAAPAEATFRFTPPVGARVETVDVTAAGSPLPALVGAGGHDRLVRGADGRGVRPARPDAAAGEWPVGERPVVPVGADHRAVHR